MYKPSKRIPEPTKDVFLNKVKFLFPNFVKYPSRSSLGKETKFLEREEYKMFETNLCVYWYLEINNKSQLLQLVL